MLIRQSSGNLENQSKVAKFFTKKFYIDLSVLPCQNCHCIVTIEPEINFHGLFQNFMQAELEIFM